MAQTKLRPSQMDDQGDFIFAGLNLDGFDDTRSVAADLDLTGQCGLNISGSGDVDIDVVSDFSGNMTVSGSANISVTSSGTISQSGGGQVTFDGNVDATNGLDVTTANLTVGGSNFFVEPGTGNVTTAGDMLVQGDMTVNGTLTTIDTEQLVIDDPIFVINLSPIGETETWSGMAANEVDGYARLGWDISEDRWELSVALDVNSDTAPTNPVAYVGTGDSTADAGDLSRAIGEADSGAYMVGVYDDPAFVSIDLSAGGDAQVQEAIKQLDAAVSGATLDSVYSNEDATAGERYVDATDGGIRWDMIGTRFIVDGSDGYMIDANGAASGSLSLGNVSLNTLTADAVAMTLTTTGGTMSLQAAGQDIDIDSDTLTQVHTSTASITSAGMTLEAGAGSMSVEADAASTYNVTGADSDFTTTTSGDINISAAGELDLDSGSTMVANSVGAMTFTSGGTLGLQASEQDIDVDSATLTAVFTGAASLDAAGNMDLETDATMTLSRGGNSMINYSADTAIEVGNGINVVNLNPQADGTQSLGTISLRWDANLDYVDANDGYFNDTLELAGTSFTVNDTLLGDVAFSALIGVDNSTIPGVISATDVQGAFEELAASAGFDRGVFIVDETTYSEVTNGSIETALARTVDQGDQTDLTDLSDNRFRDEVLIYWNGQLLRNDTAKRANRAAVVTDIARDSADPSILLFNSDIDLTVDDVVQIVDQSFQDAD